MPNGGDTKSRVGAALRRAFPNANVRTLERSSGLEVQVVSQEFSALGSDERRDRTLAALREDKGDHLHGATVEHLGGSRFRVVPPPMAIADGEVMSIQLVPVGHDVP